MLTSLFKKRSSAKRRPSRSPRRKPRRSPRLQVEALEARELLSAAPFIYTVLDDRGHSPGHTPATAQTVPLLPMFESQVLSSNWGLSTHDYYQVQLAAGQIFTASDHATGPGGVAVPNTLALLDSAGHVLASANNLTTVGDPAIAYRVSQSGTYDVEFSTSTGGSTKDAYTLDLRPIGLNSAMEDPKWVNKTGGELDVWLDGNTLDFSGPSGHGFGLRGNWHQTVTGTGTSASSTYTDSGTMYLESALGEIPIPTPGFTVTTKAGLWGQYYGALGSMTGVADLSLNDLAKPFESGSIFGLGLSVSLPEASWGIKLGSQLGSTGAPLDAAIPYIYFTFKSDVSISFGGIQVSLKYPGLNGPGVAASVVADPTDFFYIGAKNIPGPVPNLALAFSEHGLIPFLPAAKPDHFSETIYGQVYFSATVDLADDGIPISIDGNFTLNLDPNHTGMFLGGAFSTVSDFFKGLRPGAATGNAYLLGQLDIALHNVTFGENGTLNLSLKKEKWIADLQITVALETVIFDGPSQKLYLHGTVLNPLQYTALAQFIQYGANVDGYFSRNDGQFDVKVNGMINLFGAQAQAAVELSNSGASIDVDATYLGIINVDLEGFLQSNGQYLLTYQTGMNFYIGYAMATFTLQGDPTQTSFSVAADVDVLGNNVAFSGSFASNGAVTVTGHVARNFYLASGSADLIFTSSGSVTSLYVDGHMNVLGTSFDVTGYVQSNGDFVFSSSLINLNLVNLASSTASFFLSRTSGTVAFTSYLVGQIQLLAVRGELDATLNITVDPTGMSVYSGSATATVQVWAPLYGWEVWNWQWQTIAAITATVSNSDLSFNVDAFGINFGTISIPLPH